MKNFAEGPIDKSKCSHSEQPAGYLAWHAWAAKMAKTHKQTQCPNCGLWSVWVKK